MKCIRRKFRFTLVEAMVSFALFSILLVAALTFFKSSEKILDTTNQQAETYENARIFFDLISRDLQGMYYRTATNGVGYGVWQKPSTPGTEYYRNQILGFISMAEDPGAATGGGAVGLGQIKYMLWYDNQNPYTQTGTAADSAGWVMRSMTYNGSQISVPTADIGIDSPLAGFTAIVTAHCQPYQKLIPYVTDLEFYCYSIQSDTTPITPSINSLTPMQPFIIYVTLTVMNRNDWNRWLSLGGIPMYLRTDGIGGTEPPTAKNYRLLNQKTYSKTIFIGKRELTH